MVGLFHGKSHLGMDENWGYPFMETIIWGVDSILNRNDWSEHRIYPKSWSTHAFFSVSGIEAPWREIFPSHCIPCWGHGKRIPRKPQWNLPIVECAEPCHALEFSPMWFKKDKSGQNLVSIPITIAHHHPNYAQRSHAEKKVLNRAEF